MPPAYTRFRHNRERSFTDGVKLKSSGTLVYWADHNDTRYVDALVHLFYYAPLKTRYGRVICSRCGHEENVDEEVGYETWDFNLFIRRHIANSQRIDGHECPLGLVVLSQGVPGSLSVVEKRRSFQIMPPVLSDPMSNAAFQFRKLFFVKYPHDGDDRFYIDSVLLAKAGFIHDPEIYGSDRTVCMYCKCSLEEWDSDDDPLAEHRQNSPGYCYFLESLDQSRQINNKSAIRSHRKNDGTTERSEVFDTTNVLSQLDELDLDLSDHNQPDYNALRSTPSKILDDTQKSIDEEVKEISIREVKPTRRKERKPRIVKQPLVYINQDYWNKLPDEELYGELEGRKASSAPPPSYIPELEDPPAKTSAFDSTFDDSILGTSFQDVSPNKLRTESQKIHQLGTSKPSDKLKEPPVLAPIHSSDLPHQKESSTGDLSEQSILSQANISVDFPVNSDPINADADLRAGHENAEKPEFVDGTQATENMVTDVGSNVENNSDQEEEDLEDANTAISNDVSDQDQFSNNSAISDDVSDQDQSTDNSGNQVEIESDEYIPGADESSNSDDSVPYVRNLRSRRLAKVESTPGASNVTGPKTLLNSNGNKNNTEHNSSDISALLENIESSNDDLKSPKQSLKKPRKLMTSKKIRLSKQSEIIIPKESELKRTKKVKLSKASPMQSVAVDTTDINLGDYSNIDLLEEDIVPISEPLPRPTSPEAHHDVLKEVIISPVKAQSKKIASVKRTVPSHQSIFDNDSDEQSFHVSVSVNPSPIKGRFFERKSKGFAIDDDVEINVTAKFNSNVEPTKLEAEYESEGPLDQNSDEMFQDATAEFKDSTAEDGTLQAQPVIAKDVTHSSQNPNSVQVEHPLEEGAILKIPSTEGVSSIILAQPVPQTTTKRKRGRPPKIKSTSLSQITSSNDQMSLEMPEKPVASQVVNENGENESEKIHNAKLTLDESKGEDIANHLVETSEINGQNKVSYSPVNELSVSDPGMVQSSITVGETINKDGVAEIVNSSGNEGNSKSENHRAAPVHEIKADETALYSNDNSETLIDSSVINYSVIHESGDLLSSSQTKKRKRIGADLSIEMNEFLNPPSSRLLRRKPKNTKKTDPAEVINNKDIGDHTKVIEEEMKSSKKQKITSNKTSNKETKVVLDNSTDVGRAKQVDESVSNVEILDAKIEDRHTDVGLETELNQKLGKRAKKDSTLLSKTKKKRKLQGGNASTELSEPYSKTKDSKRQALTKSDSPDPSNEENELSNLLYDMEEDASEDYSKYQQDLQNLELEQLNIFEDLDEAKGGQYEDKVNPNDVKGHGSLSHQIESSSDISFESGSSNKPLSTLTRPSKVSKLEEVEGIVEQVESPEDQDLNVESGSAIEELEDSSDVEISLSPIRSSQNEELIEVEFVEENEKEALKLSSISNSESPIEAVAVSNEETINAPKVQPRVVHGANGASDAKQSLDAKVVLGAFDSRSSIPKRLPSSERKRIARSNQRLRTISETSTFKIKHIQSGINDAEDEAGSEQVASETNVSEPAPRLENDIEKGKIDTSLVVKSPKDIEKVEPEPADNLPATFESPKAQIEPVEFAKSIFNLPLRSPAKNTENKRLVVETRANFERNKSVSPTKNKVSKLATWAPGTTDKFKEEVEYFNTGAQYLHKLANSNTYLHEDDEGELTHFISCMPADEGEMTIEEWVNHNADHYARELRSFLDTIRSDFEQQHERAIQAIVDISTDEEDGDGDDDEE